MRKIVISLVLVLMAMFSLSAETYSVKYKNEFGNTERAYYTVTEEDKEELGPLVIYMFKVRGATFEVIDDDSELGDIAIVNKLDKQGYKVAYDDFTFGNVKYIKYWYKLKGTWYIVHDKEVRK